MPQRNRTVRRQQERAARKNGANLLRPGQQITLQNPVQDQFPPFIFGNALMWERLALEELQRVAPAEVERLTQADAAAPLAERMVGFLETLERTGCDLMVCKENSAKGQHLILCGAGPSLKEHAAEWCPQGDQIWGCNSGVTFLHHNGYKPTHGFTVDQTAEMLGEWITCPDVEYLLASTVHPHLAEFLVGRGRKIRFFHNFVGIRRAPVDCGDGEILPYEDWLYQILFPATVRLGAGLNAVNRAIELAQFMGFAKITVLGADCAMRAATPPPSAPIGSPENKKWLSEQVVMHADGGSALASNQSMLTLDGMICSQPGCGAERCSHPKRWWLTKADLMISAVWLEKQRQKAPEQIFLIGDTLPVALRDKPDSYLKRLPVMIDGDGKPLPWG